MPFNIPILLTFVRVGLIPVFVLAFYLPFQWAPLACGLIFIIASITDWFDGYLARLWNQTTKFGAFLDPVADKVMVVIALILVAEYFHEWWVTLPAAAIITREIVISALREWMAETAKGKKIVVSRLGKIKTTSQMIAIFALLWHPNILIKSIGILTLYIATGLTFWSMFYYLNAARNKLI